MACLSFNYLSLTYEDMIQYTASVSTKAPDGTNIHLS